MATYPKITPEHKAAILELLSVAQGALIVLIAAQSKIEPDKPSEQYATMLSELKAAIMLNRAFIEMKE